MSTKTMETSLASSSTPEHVGTNKEEEEEEKASIESETAEITKSIVTIADSSSATSFSQEAMRENEINQTKEEKVVFKKKKSRFFSFGRIRDYFRRGRSSSCEPKEKEVTLVKVMVDKATSTEDLVFVEPPQQPEKTQPPKNVNYFRVEAYL